jgi:serine/threonine-protein phosphatase 2A regulatory subunit B'
MQPVLKAEVILKFLNKTFLKSFVELFDSEDPRERDYLKTILHRMYGKFMPLRQTIKEQIMNLLLRIIADAETYNGLTELLEILGSITNGLSVPLKQEHQDFFRRVLIPLHKIKTLQTFNTQLQICVKNYLEKQTNLSNDLIRGLLKFWPITCPAKEVIFIGEIEEVLDLLKNSNENKFAEFGTKLLRRLLLTAQGMHYQAAERSLLLLNSEVI